MKITVITVCFHSEKTIAETFDSVLRQTYSPIEYIVIDGKSGDGTLRIIQQYEKRFTEKGISFHWVSEKDKGLYDAINKGIAMSTGDVIGILNSDDILALPDTLAKIAGTFERDGCDAVYSDLYIMDPESMSRPNRVFIAGKKSYKLGWYPPHPTLYVRREVYEKYGNYSLKYRIVSDYDFMLRIMKDNIRMSYIPEVLVYMRAGGVSTNSLKSYKKSFDESIDALKENGIRTPYCVNTLRTLGIFKQRFLGIMKSRK